MHKLKTQRVHTHTCAHEYTFENRSVGGFRGVALKDALWKGTGTRVLGVSPSSFPRFAAQGCRLFSLDWAQSPERQKDKTKQIKTLLS